MLLVLRTRWAVVVLPGRWHPVHMPGRRVWGRQWTDDVSVQWAVCCRILLSTRQRQRNGSALWRHRQVSEGFFLGGVVSCRIDW
jgi:hypothetical protein